MKGTTFRRCGCRDEDGRQLGSGCPRVGSKGHGTWFYVVQLPRGADGRRRQLRAGGFATKAEAEAELHDVVDDLRNDRWRDDGRRTTETYLREWLNNKVADGLLRPTTERSYRLHVDRYIVPTIGHLRLRDLRTAHVSRMLRELRSSNGSQLGATSRRRVHATLRSALADARREGLVKTNAASDATVPRAERPKVQPWEPDELGRFLDYAASHRLGALIELIALAGLRRGEACGLRWADVDVERGYLVVRQQIVQVGRSDAVCRDCGETHRGIAFGQPKTASGTARRVDLSQVAVGVVLAQRMAQESDRGEWGPAYRDHDLVFAREDGMPLAPERVTKVFAKLVREAGVRPVRVHDLRHGAASLLLASGADLAVVSKMLGHSSITITADTYAHLLEGVGRTAADAAAALVPRRSPGLPTCFPQAHEDGAVASPEGRNRRSGGAPSGTRTPNPLIKSQLLCQLS